MSKIQINLSGQKGLAPKHRGDILELAPQPHLRYISEPGQMVSGVWNPFRKAGYMCPANNTFLQQITVSPIGILPFDYFTFAYENGNDEWVMGYDLTGFVSGSKNPYISGVGLISYNSFFETPVHRQFDDSYLSGSIEPGYDMIKYQLNGDDIYFIMNNMDDIMISNSNVFTNPVSTSWLTTLANNPSNLELSDKGATFTLADNGFLYILDGSAIHKIDGSPLAGVWGSVEAEVLSFPEGFFIQDAVDHRGAMWITVKQGEKMLSEGRRADKYNLLCGVYVWDRFSNIVRMRDFIQINGVSHVGHIWTDKRNDIYIMTMSTDGILQIRKFNGSRFDIVAELEYETRTLSNKYSIRQIGNWTFIITTSGKIYSFGALIEGEKNQLYRIGEFPTLPNNDTLDDNRGHVMSYGGSIGSFLNKNGFNVDYNKAHGSLVLGINGDANAYIYNWYFNTVGAIDMRDNSHGLIYPGLLATLEMKAHPGNAFTPVQFLPKLSNVKDLTIYCVPTVDSDDTEIATVRVYFNQASSNDIGNKEKVQIHTVTRKEANRGYIHIPINKQYVNAVQVEVEWDTDQVLGDNDFCTSFGILDYSATKTDR